MKQSLNHRGVPTRGIFRYCSEFSFYQEITEEEHQSILPFSRRPVNQFLYGRFSLMSLKWTVTTWTSMIIFVFFILNGSGKTVIFTINFPQAGPQIGQCVSPWTGQGTGQGDNSYAASSTPLAVTQEDCLFLRGCGSTFGCWIFVQLLLQEWRNVQRSLILWCQRKKNVHRSLWYCDVEENRSTVSDTAMSKKKLSLVSDTAMWKKKRSLVSDTAMWKKKTFTGFWYCDVKEKNIQRSLVHVVLRCESGRIDRKKYQWV